jgi:hypothetical protein
MFIPTAEELAATEAGKYLRIHQSGYEGLNLKDSSLHVSSSKWHDGHLKSLQVVPLLDLHIDRMLPPGYLHENNGGFTFVAKLALLS